MSIRKIKNAVNNTTGELIYFKGHAQATYMSDGSTVEDAINNIESKIDLSDYVKSEELEGYAKTSDIPSLEGLAKTEDIPSIEGLATEEFVTSQGYLTEVPSEYITDIELNAKGYATKTELDSIDFNDINNTPFTTDESGELNITDEAGNIGIKLSEDGIYVKDVIAGEHVLSNKMDNTTFKTINGEDILGEGNIIIEAGNFDANVQAVDTGDVLDDVNVEYATSEYVSNLVGDINTILENIIGGNVVAINGHREIAHGTSDTSITIQPNVLHIWDVVTSLNIELSDEVSGIVNEYTFQFKSGSTPTILSLPNNIKWNNDTTPTIEANKQYQISILKGLASILSTSI